MEGLGCAESEEDGGEGEGSAMKIYYFGCWDERKGHFLYKPNGHRPDVSESKATPWPSFYALCPRGDEDYVPTEEQVEGHASLCYKDGWTSLGFWDRSADPRGNSVSVFLAEGTYGPSAMIEIAKASFPTVWRRYGFEVRVVSRPNDIVNVTYTCFVCGREGHGAVLDRVWVHDPPGWFRSIASLGVRSAFACSVRCVTKANG